MDRIIPESSTVGLVGRTSSACVLEICRYEFYSIHQNTGETQCIVGCRTCQGRHGKVEQVRGKVFLSVVWWDKDKNSLKISRRKKSNLVIIFSVKLTGRPISGFNFAGNGNLLSL